MRQNCLMGVLSWRAVSILSDRIKLEPLFIPLQNGFRFLLNPLPSTPSSSLTRIILVMGVFIKQTFWLQALVCNRCAGLSYLMGGFGQSTQIQTFIQTFRSFRLSSVFRSSFFLKRLAGKRLFKRLELTNDFIRGFKDFLGNLDKPEPGIQG